MHPSHDYTPIERQLLSDYGGTFRQRGFRGREADTHASDMLNMAIEKAQQTGRYGVGPLGQRMLSDYPGPWRDYFEEVRRVDGVTTQDIVAWWDLDEVERQAAILDDDQARMGAFISSLQRLSDPDRAADEVKKSFPMYGIIGQMHDPQTGIRLLPYELKDRINRWMNANGPSLAASARRPWDQSPSFNVWVRSMIHSGSL